MIVRAATLLAILLACRIAGAQARDEVYVWQRHWTPAVRDALLKSRDLFGGLRVLVAQGGRDGRWLGTDASAAAFVGDPRRIAAVIRFDGASSPPDPATLQPRIERLLREWRAGGVTLAAIEIDYDCASAHLADYAQRLRDVKAFLPVDVELSITALPTWIDAAGLDAVLAAADTAVLQLHAVDDPRRGLFDAQRAESALRAFARHTHKDFSIALPAYGSRVRFDADGRAAAVESEMPVDASAGEGARDLAVDPAAVVDFLRRVHADPPPHWRNAVWFRLPVAGDRRAWTLAALRDVVDGRVPLAVVSVDVVAREGGAADIVLANRGHADGRASGVRLRATDCSAADAADGWRVERRADGWHFAARPAQRIRAGSRRTIGWIRCASTDAAAMDDATGE